MKWFWVISASQTVPDPLVTCSDNFGGREDEFVLGRPFAGSEVPLRVTASLATSSGVLDDALQNHLALPILSERVRKAMDNIGVHGIEFVPVQVTRADLTVAGEYSILNALERRRALDRSRSDYDTFPDDYPIVRRRGAIRALRMPVLKESETRATDVLRLDEYPYQLYVTERVSRLFTEGNFSGWSFREVATR